MGRETSFEFILHRQQDQRLPHRVIKERTANMSDK
jgi:hypothetical protein